MSSQIKTISYRMYDIDRIKAHPEKKTNALRTKSIHIQTVS